VFELPSADAVVFEFESAAVFELESVAVLAFASTLSVEAGASAGVSGLLLKTETLPVNAGIARNNADSMNTVAAPIVTLDITVAVPRGVRAELEMLLVNRAPASVLPGCRRTAPTSTKQERKNKPYKK
jgi:hypothetical protein